MAQVDLNDVALFVRVVDRAGFAKVARELRVPTSTVSRAVSRLEATVGAQLLMRSTRSVVPTAEGSAFYREVAPAVASLHQAARGVDGADRKARGKLRVTTANDIGATFLGEVVASFCARHPHIEVETILTQRPVNLVEEGVDVALRAASRLPDSSLVARKVGELEQDLYASSGYLAAHGFPSSLEDLDQHPCLVFRAQEGAATWRLHDERGSKETVTAKEVRGRIATDDFSFMRSALLAGAGIALIPRLMITGDVEAGRLVRVLPQYSSHGASLFFVHVATSTLPAKIALFREHVTEAFARRR